MDIRPLSKYKKPSYPTKDEVIRNPLLLKSIPERWKGNIAVSAALTSLLAITATSCSTSGVGKTTDSVSSMQEHALNVQNSKSMQRSENTGITAVLNSNSSTNMNGSTEGGVLEDSPMNINDKETRDKIAPETADESILENTSGNASGNASVNASGTVDEPVDIMPETIPEPITPKNEYYRARNSNDEVDVQDVIILNDINIPPVFVHGDGRGSFGCMSIAPPVFLSEDEAYEVIIKEAESFDLNEWKLDKYLLGQNGEYYTSISSVEEFYAMAAANSLREGISSKTGNKKVGIFYDPMPDYTEEQFEALSSGVYDENVWSKLAAEQKERAKGLLREQVIDFLNWLKAQGII